MGKTVKVYTTKVDEIIFEGEPLSDMTSEEFLELAQACLDQGGVSLSDQTKIAKILGLKPLTMREG